MGIEKIVRTSEVIGVFDLDTSTVKKTTRDFLKNTEKSKRVEVLSSEIPRSFILCEEKNKNDEDFKVYLSPINSTTLIKVKKAEKGE